MVFSYYRFRDIQYSKKFLHVQLTERSATKRVDRRASNANSKEAEAGQLRLPPLGCPRLSLH